jgi:hypothetical protein
MKDTEDDVIQAYKWTAFMKLRGQTSLRNEKEIIGEFDGFVQSLQRVGVDYNIIVMVEDKSPQQLHSEHKLKAREARITREGAGT